MTQTRIRFQNSGKRMARPEKPIDILVDSDHRHIHSVYKQDIEAFQSVVKSEYYHWIENYQTRLTLNNFKLQKLVLELPQHSAFQFHGSDLIFQKVDRPLTSKELDIALRIKAIEDLHAKRRTICQLFNCVELWVPERIFPLKLTRDCMYLGDLQFSINWTFFL